MSLKVVGQTHLSFATNLCNVFVFVVGVANMSTVNKMKPENLNQFPYTVYVCAELPYSSCFYCNNLR